MPILSRHNAVATAGIDDMSKLNRASLASLATPGCRSWTSRVGKVVLGTEFAL